jgi:hypothetical protein
LLVGCSSGGRSDRADLRRLVAQESWDQALELLERSKFYQDEKSELLLLFERGHIYHLSGRVRESIEEFERAKSLARELFTRSLGAAAQALMANDNFDVYYGAPYELSMVHFLQCLNFLALSEQETNEGNRYWIFAARAEVMAWDAHLRQLTQEREGAIYKENLLARVMGGIIHQSLGTREELMIALQLYKDGLLILERHGAAYPLYNSRYKEFIRDYKSLPGLPREKLFEDYILPTEHFSEVESFLKNRIKSVERALGPSQTKVEYKPTTALIIREGMMPAVIPARQYFGLDYTMVDSEGTKILVALSAAVISLFAAETLGLLPPPQSYTPIGAQFGYEVSHAIVSGLGIQFELPAVESHPHPSTGVRVQWKKEDGIEEVVAPVFHPLGLIAEQALAENSFSRFTRVGIRVALKHVAALVASYGTYRLIYKEGDESTRFLARNAAVIQYIGAARAIAASERADTRHWATLPRTVRLAELPRETSFDSLLLVRETQKIQLPNVDSAGAGKILHSVLVAH